jgi:ABC-type xylose transport system substrate-binding protein
MTRFLVFLCAAIVLTFTASSTATFAETPATSAEDKVLVVMIFDGGCHLWCDQVRPIISSVTKEYGDKVALRELDVQKSALQDSLGKAEHLGVKSFVVGAMSLVPTIGVFTPDRKLIRSIPGVGKGPTYKKYIERALKAG